MKIDLYNHVMPVRYLEMMQQHSQDQGIIKRMSILLGKRYLIHDRDTKYTEAFDAFMGTSGVEPVLLPPRSPNLNAHCERFVRSIKEEALTQMVMLGNAPYIMRSSSTSPIITTSAIIRVSPTN